MTEAFPQSCGIELARKRVGLQMTAAGLVQIALAAIVVWAWSVNVALGIGFLLIALPAVTAVAVDTGKRIHKVTLSDDGLYCRGITGQTKLEWKELQSIRLVGTDRVYLRRRWSSPISLDRRSVRGNFDAGVRSILEHAQLLRIEASAVGYDGRYDDSLAAWYERLGLETPQLTDEPVARAAGDR